MGRQCSYRADLRRLRACGAWPARRQSWMRTMASARCSSTGTSEAASKGITESKLSSESYRGMIQAMETVVGVRGCQDSLSRALDSREGFYSHLPGHGTAAARPGRATWPPVPLGCRGHYQKQQIDLGPSFSSFFSFVCSMEKDLCEDSRRAREAFSHQCPLRTN